MKRHIILSIAILSILILGSGCKKYLDVNKNPNVAQDVPVEMLLPSAQMYLASSMDVYMQVNGSIWAQYWTQAPSASQYKIYEQYSPSASDYDRPWSLFYSSSLEDLDRIEKKGNEQNKKEYVAVAKIMKAYIYQVVTDAWGDVPFSQSLSGLPEDGTIISPQFDAQQNVYTGIAKMLDDARTIIQGLTTQSVSGDLIYSGDMEKWLRFANTLELKVYLRLSEKSPATAQAGIASLFAGNNDFIDVGDDAQINFLSAAGNQNPLYSEISGLGFTQNLVASATVVDSMNANSDYRAYYFFDPISVGVVGIPQGAYTLPSSTQVSVPSAVTGANAKDANSATAPVKFLSAYESKFLQAEAVARGWGVSGSTAEELFLAGIDASFRDPISSTAFANNYGLTADDALYAYFNGDTSAGTPAAYWGQYPATGTVQQQVRHIITQKWFAMTGTQGFEAWTEWRRTGYPDFFTYSVNSIIGDIFPRRFLYPNVELTRNQNFPGQKTVTQKVWWDIH